MFDTDHVKAGSPWGAATYAGALRRLRCRAFCGAARRAAALGRNGFCCMRALLSGACAQRFGLLWPLAFTIPAIIKMSICSL